MNNKGQNMIGQSIIFLGLWLITGVVWSIWFDGIYVALVGCFTALAVLGAINVTVNINR